MEGSKPGAHHTVNVAGGTALLIDESYLPTPPDAGNSGAIGKLKPLDRRSGRDEGVGDWAKFHAALIERLPPPSIT
jgi:hypothetical protein